MRSLRTLVALLSLFGFVADATSASHPNQSSPFVIFETSDAPGKLDSTKIEECLRLTLREMNVDGRQLPRIVIYHISPEAGRYLGIDTNSNWRSSGGGHLRYEMWIVGPPSNSLLTYCSRMFSSDTLNCRWMKPLARE